jgi:hypothetical protein
VAELGASNGDYHFCDLVQNVADAMQMPRVKRLISANQQAPMFNAIQFELPISEGYALILSA